jgi:hypothetical protein
VCERLYIEVVGDCKRVKAIGTLTLINQLHYMENNDGETDESTLCTH